MKYEIDKVGEPGRLYIESDDILQVKPSKTHAAEMRVRYRRQYQETGAFVWQSRTKDLALPLIARQVVEIVGQEREAQQGFCTDCFDWGKCEEPPKDCLRCQLLKTCAKAGHGDYRKGKPERSYGASWVRDAALVGMVLLWWWTLIQWTAASTQRDAALSLLRRAKISTSDNR